MKKRFFTFLMAVWALLSISQTVKAADSPTGNDAKYYLFGSMNNNNWDEPYCPFTTTDDGKTYTCTLSTNQDVTVYFKPKRSADGSWLAPGASNAYITTELQSTTDDDNGAWMLDAKSNKTYTIILDCSGTGNPMIKYTEGGSGDVVTSNIQLFNGETALTGSNGRYTLDLSNVTSDASITLTIDGEKYGLAEAKTIDAVGTTSDIAFTTEGTKALTLKAGFIYSITVTDEGKMTVVASVDTIKNNPLPKRTYTQGYYLAGNFFTFSGDKVTYDDAVFKFQQQKNDATIESGKDYEVYKVEIPASLTAHAQVMYVDEFGKTKSIFGPGQKIDITNTDPQTNSSTSWFSTLANVCDPITKENSNYWNFISRNASASQYSDGMYNLYIAVEAKTHTIKKWKIEHIGNKRVAFFISDAKNATAMPLYDTYKKSPEQFSNKFYASINLSAEHSYYVISNYVVDKQYVDETSSNNIEKLSSQYDAHKPDGDVVSCPTTNKLFLLGNGGYPVETADDHNQFSPNEKPMKPADNQQGSIIVEYNPSKGKINETNANKYLGIRGEVIIKDTRVKLTSISMVGDAIPGTVKEGGIWDYASTAADMTYDETEKCYKVTLVTTAKDGAAKFRFVGNHTKEINWHEDSTTDPKMKAKTPLDGNGEGHEATPYDPNKVNYTEKGSEVNPGKDWDIIWNRPAGRWTVRLYFYTYNKDNGNGDNIPVTDYYYTISENRELELRDFNDVVYKDVNNKRTILNRGEYKYFRTWSAVKAWEISKDVDIFVVDGKTVDTDKRIVKFSLKKINADPTGKKNVIPSNTGVILATKNTYDKIEGGAQVFERASLTSYNTMVIPIKEYNSSTEATADYKDTNLLKPLIEAQVVHTMDHTTYNGVTGDYYNYLFGFFNAKKGLGVTTGYEDNEFLMGFWISKGTGAFYNNSAYLPILEADAKIMGLGVSHNDIDPTSGAKKVPALFFDFANVDGTTGIDEVVNTTVKNHDGKYYTLSGQQVEKPTAGGVYIHNGKKFVVK